MIVALPDAESGEAQVVTLAEAVDLLSPQAIIEALCTQERAFGQSRLSPPEVVR